MNFDAINQFSDSSSPNQVVMTCQQDCCEPECMCDPPSENYPYSEKTFKLIERMAPEIRSYSKKYGVPPIAVAGAIADEYNTQTGLKGVGDWIQDEVLLNTMSNSQVELDVWIGSDSKFFNATKHDIGVGNIKLETAKRLYDQYPGEFERKDWGYADIVDYLRTEKGTAHMAALYIAHAQRELSSHVASLCPDAKEAVLVTYYKQGPAYLKRFLAAKTLEPDREIKPGEGCRVWLQRNKFEKIFPDPDPAKPMLWDGLDDKYRGEGGTRYA